MGGERCPYSVYALETMEGHEAWDIILRCDTQLRTVHPGNVLGFDLPALLSVAAALGYEMQAFVALVTSAEGGMLHGIRERHHGNA